MTFFMKNKHVIKVVFLKVNNWKVQNMCLT